MRNLSIKIFVQILTLIITLISFSNQPLIVSSSLVIAILLIVFIGIPHGANDHLLFFRLFQNKLRENNKSGILFYGSYLGLIFLYALCWYFFPLFSLGLFIAISIYHFGQSNLYASPLKSNLLAILLSGIFVLMTPILAHLEEAKPIILLLSQNENLISINFEQGRQISVWLGICTLLFWFMLIIIKKMSWKTGLSEIANGVLLFNLFYFAPLWIGFAVYFTLWHSVPSIEDQINFFKKKCDNYHLGKYIKEILPYTLLAILGLMITLKFSGGFITQVQGISLMFAFIAVITLPHMIMMELLYKQIGKTENEMN